MVRQATCLRLLAGVVLGEEAVSPWQEWREYPRGVSYWFNPATGEMAPHETFVSHSHNIAKLYVSVECPFSGH